MKPLNDFLVIEPKKQENKTASGILIESAERPGIATVVAVSDQWITNAGIKREIQVKVGDEVIFHEGGARPHKEGDRNLLVLRYENILAILCQEDQG